MSDDYQRGDGDITLTAVDQVDGQFVLEARSSGGGGALGNLLAAGEGVSIELTAGAGDVEPDPYTGRFILTPRDDAPIRGRAVHESRAGTSKSEDAPLGMGVGSVPTLQLRSANTGGGACAAVFHPAGLDESFDVHVRASVMANVVPLSPEQREIHWRHGLYFAHDPVIGLMRLQYNPALDSKLVMLKSNGNGDFFPARAENALYFTIDFVDLGFRAFNKEPMTQRIDKVEWPPFGDPVLAIEKPLEFFDVDEPDRLVMTLKSQDMRLYDYSSLEVERLDSTIDRDGVLETAWRITNQSDERVRARWFALGDFEAREGEPVEGVRLLGQSGSEFASFDLKLRVDTTRSLVRQSMSMNVVSLTDSILAGRAQVDYRRTDEERQIV